MNVNIVMLSGNLVRDPELKDIGTSKVCNMTIAVNDRYKAKDGQWKEKTAFIAVTVWGKNAENCAQYLGKGSSVFVEGKLDQESWEDKDKKKITKIKVTATQVQFLNQKPKELKTEPQPSSSEEWA